MITPTKPEIIEKTDVEIKMPRRLNDVLTAAADEEAAFRLFDAFWRTGELAVLYGPPGSGKSVLAVQIADGLARGRPIEGLDMPAERRRVLYVDLVLSDKQFEMRYSRPGRGGSRIRYRFSQGIWRAKPKPGVDLVKWLSAAIAKYGFDTVVIDDLAPLMRFESGSSDVADIMRGLREVVQERGVSMLVLADSARPKAGQYASEADIRCGRVICSAADSVFGINVGGCEHTRRLVQTRCQAEPIIWSAERHGLRSILSEENDGFLGLRFDDVALRAMSDEMREHVARVYHLHAQLGQSFRQIAREMDIPVSRVHRLYRKWRPGLKLPEPVAVESVPVPGPQAEEPRGNESDYYDEDSAIFDDEMIEEPEETKADPVRPTIYDLPTHDNGRETWYVAAYHENQPHKPAIWYRKDRTTVKLCINDDLGTNSYSLNNSIYLDELAIDLERLGNSCYRIFERLVIGKESQNSS